MYTTTVWIVWIFGEMRLFPRHALTASRNKYWINVLKLLSRPHNVIVQKSIMSDTESDCPTFEEVLQAVR